MKKNIKETTPEKLITRKQAIQKVGITALTTASLMFLQTKAHAGDSVGKAARPGTNRPSRQ